MRHNKLLSNGTDLSSHGRTTNSWGVSAWGLMGPSPRRHYWLTGQGTKSLFWNWGINCPNERFSSCIYDIEGRRGRRQGVYLGGGGGKNVSLLLREPKNFAPALKKSGGGWGGGGGGDSDNFFFRLQIFFPKTFHNAVGVLSWRWPTAELTSKQKHTHTKKKWNHGGGGIAPPPPPVAPRLEGRTTLYQFIFNNL